MSTHETLKEMNEKPLDEEAPPGSTFAVVGLTYFGILILVALAVAAYIFMRPASSVDSTEPENSGEQSSWLEAPAMPLIRVACDYDSDTGWS